MASPLTMCLKEDKIYYLEQAVTTLEAKVNVLSKLNDELITNLESLTSKVNASLEDVERLKRENKSVSDYINMMQTPTLNDLT
jgi:outer membrane murein-binding lipoprotein Lpp